MKVQKLIGAFHKAIDQTASYPDKTLMNQIVQGLESLPSTAAERVEQCYQAQEKNSSRGQKPSGSRSSQGSSSQS